MVYIKEHLTNFSKLTITVLTIMWIIGAIYAIIFGSIMVWKTQMYLGDLLSFIGLYVIGMVAPSLIGYFVSKAIENKEKIKCSHEERMNASSHQSDPSGSTIDSLS